MVDQQARGLRRRVARHGGGRGKRYPAVLRAEVSRWARERYAANGGSWSAIAAEVGLRMETVRRWATSEVPERPRGIVAVELIAGAIAKPVVISPNGYRVEGLSVDEVVGLLRELS